MVKEKRQAKGKGASSGTKPKETSTKGTGGSTSKSSQSLNSHEIFKLCVERAKNLIKLHEAAHGKAGKPEKYTSDAHRAAIVLAIAALDAFIRAFVISKVRILLAAKSQALPPALSAQIKRFVKDDELLEAARKDDLLDRVEKAFRSDFERRSFQGIKNIEEMLAIVGYNDVFHEIAMKAKMNEDTLCTDLDRFTQRRHAIAHRGDYDLNQNPPKENVVTKKDANECIKLITTIAAEIHKLGATA